MTVERKSPMEAGETWVREPKESWVCPNPISEQLHDISHRARYSPETLTPSDAMQLATIADAYFHFTAYDEGRQTDSVLAQLRKVRAWVREQCAKSKEEE